MEQFIMKGGNPLVGEVTISGAKNAALGILAASILTDEDVLIENLPDVRDINVFLEAVSEIGAMVDRIDRHTVRINAKGIHAIHVDDEYIRRIRASYYFIGALLGKYKSAQVPLPGGCNIGSRPIDQHLKGFRALGAKVQVENGAVLAHAIDLVGTHIYLDMVSVGATINIMMAATLAEGETIIENPAKEPHVVDVANFLNSMGANVKGAGTDVIRIRGVHKLHGTASSNSVTSQPISISFAEIASRCFGMTFCTITSPRVIAAAHINVPASIWSGMIEYSVPCSLWTPRMRSLSRWAVR